MGFFSDLDLSERCGYPLTDEEQEYKRFIQAENRKRYEEEKTEKEYQEWCKNQQKQAISEDKLMQEEQPDFVSNAEELTQSEQEKTVSIPDETKQKQPVSKTKKGKKKKDKKANYGEVLSAEDKAKMIEWLKTITAGDTFHSAHHIYTLYHYTDAKTGLIKTTRKQVCWFFPEKVEEIVSKKAFYKSADYYVTKNGYIADQMMIEATEDKPSRQALLSLDNIVIDIDQHADNANPDDIRQDIDALLYYLREEYGEKIPPFDAIKSGRGVQLWFKIEPMAMAMSWLYHKAYDGIAQNIKKAIEKNDLNLDFDAAASKREGGIMRLPYTYNQHTQAQVTLEIGCDEKCSVDMLKELFITEPDERYETVKSINTRRMTFIEEIIKRCKGEITDDKRKSAIIWLYYNSAKMLMSDDEAMDKLKKLNGQLSAPFSDKALMQEIRGVQKVGYYYGISVPKFLKYLQATKSEKDLYNQMAMSAEYCKTDADFQEKARLKQQTEEQKAEKAKKSATIIQTKGDYSRSDYKRMVFIEELVKHRNGNVTGSRDTLTWVYYNYALAVSGDHTTAFDKLKQLNSTFTEPQTEEELTEQIKSVQKIGYYKLKKITLFETLNATEQEKEIFDRLSKNNRHQKKTEKAKRNLDIINLRAEGKTEKEIADELKISIRTVRNILKDTNKTDKQKRDKAILRLHKQGKSISEIAKEVKITYPTVKKIIANADADAVSETDTANTTPTIKATHNLPESDVLDAVTVQVKTETENENVNLLKKIE